MFCTGSLPRKWSIRNTLDSGRYLRSTRFSSLAEARSRPNGFSTTRRAPRALPEAASPLVTVANMLGGVAVVAVDVAEQGRQFGEGVGVDAAVLLQAVTGARPQPLKVPP